MRGRSFVAPNANTPEPWYVLPDSACRSTYPNDDQHRILPPQSGRGKGKTYSRTSSGNGCSRSSHCLISAAESNCPSGRCSAGRVPSPSGKK